MNKVILMGRLTADPNTSETAAGTHICRFTIAVNRRFSAEGQASVDFIDCLAWAKTADFIRDWFGKGSMIAIVGSVRVNKWTDREGTKRQKTEINVDEAYFTGEKTGKKADNPSGANDDEFGFVVGDDEGLPF